MNRAEGEYIIMNIQETISIENTGETTETTTNNNMDVQEHFDMPVARANAVAFILLFIQLTMRLRKMNVEAC